jgi:crotonobetainyl-CoA:carnitine CoA-transferase CaiB-like acyl-CoA transferase
MQGEQAHHPGVDIRIWADGSLSRPASFDQIAQGMGGLMSITGAPGEGLMRAGIAIADSGAGIFAAVGILVALAERERSGEGQWVQTSLLEAQISLLVGQPVQLSRTPAHISSPAPEAGEHTEEILAEIGINAASVLQLRAANVI